MRDFSFYCPTRLVFGRGQTKRCGEFVRQSGFTRVLLVSGQGATKRSAGFAAVQESLADAGVAFEVFDGLTPDPSSEQVMAAAEILRAAELDGLVAYGGGSPIDCAKSAAMAYANNVNILDILYGKVIPTKEALPLIAVPTTAGTGTEMSAAAVTTDTKLGRKTGFTHDSFFPRLAIVDPDNHVSMPPAVTAATGMDALTHVIESYVSLGANPAADAINIQSAELIARSLPRAFRDGNDIEARAAMAFASAYAGAAFSQTGLGMVHGFAHAVGARHGTAHGEANAVLLPYVLAALIPAAAGRMRDLAAAMGACPRDTSPERGASALVEFIVRLKEELGIAQSLGAIGVTRAAAPALLADAATYRARPRSPRAFSDAELGRILEAAIEGNMQAAAF